jgi:hypothetical protein
MRKRRGIALSTAGLMLAALAGAAAPAAADGPNGRIAFASYMDGDYDIYTMNPDGTELSNLTDAFGAWDDTDPNWSHIERLEDLSMTLRDEISHFFSIYKTPEWKVVKVDGWYPREEALESIERAKRRFSEKP